MNGRGERRNIDTDSKRESEGGLTVLVFFANSACFRLLRVIKTERERQSERRRQMQ